MNGTGEISDVAQRLRRLEAERVAREVRRQRHQDLALLKVMVDGANDLDYAAIFASIDPGESA